MQINWREKATALAEISDFSSFEISGVSGGAQKPLAVACSGGADSLAALLLTWAKFPDARERLFVLHFDHAVRAESGEDAEFVREVCSALGIGFICEKRVSESGEKLGETELRRARLDFFAREMRARNCKILVQGHQRDDIAETLLMRLTRGAGTDGLAAPRKISRQADGRVFVRPLLDFPKAKIVSALRACEIPWREDSTNAGTDYFRNRVRNRVLPELRAAAPFENIARSRKLAEEDADALDFLAEKITNEAQAQTERTAECSRVYKLCGGSGKNVASPVRLPAIARRVLRKIFLREKIETDGAAVIDALVNAVCAGTPKKIRIGSRKIIWTGSELFAGEAALPSLPQKTGNDENVASHGVFAEKIEVTEELLAKIRAGAFPPTETVFLAGTPEIFARKLLPGEKYRPLGSPGEKSVRRIFIDKKIPQNCRKTLPVFADGTGIAWIPGLPPAERFRIREAGTSALRLTYRREALPL
ncbi:MAG: tRNA lysidine(34) synthetase TilS [Verrucomicrobia bacterium]|nr:tRNA lysidine(34) synthetase TilS [Verrucomicrobiota bacterium]